jgi:hypothetical protein
MKKQLPITLVSTKTAAKVAERVKHIAYREAEELFDLNNQTGTWSITPENERAYMLQDIVEANRRWSGK